MGDALGASTHREKTRELVDISDVPSLALACISMVRYGSVIYGTKSKSTCLRYFQDASLVA